MAQAESAAARDDALRQVAAAQAEQDAARAQRVEATAVLISIIKRDLAEEAASADARPPKAPRREASTEAVSSDNGALGHAGIEDVGDANTAPQGF